MKSFSTCALLATLSLAYADEPSTASPLAPQNLSATNAATERAADFETALVRAKATGKDIAVFQYGSDWNPLSLSLFQNSWNKDALLSAAGPGFVLVAIDQPEVVGGRALYGRCTAEKCGLTGFSDQPIGSSAPLRLEALAKTEPPSNAATEITSEGGVAFIKRIDGAFVVNGGSVPATDTLTLQLKATKGGRVVRVDFPALSPVMAGFAGFAENGNFCLSGATVSLRGKPIAINAVKADKWHDEFVPANLIKPASDPSNHEWNAAAHTGGARTLWLELANPVPAGTELTLQLDAKTRWSQHVPVAVRAAMVDALPADPTQPGSAPENQVTSVVSDQGLPYTKAADGSFAARIAKNPAQDTLTLRLKPTLAGSVLRLDFPLDHVLPNGGPGRAGNAVISEVEIQSGSLRITPQFAWGSRNGGNNFGPWTAVDGKTDNPNEGWNMYGGERQPRTLLIALKDPLPAGKDVTVRIVCKSQWGQHVPGCVRAALLSDGQTLEDVRAVAAAQVQQSRNRQFTFAGWGKMPRLSLLDAQGRPVGADIDLRLGLSSEGFAAKIKALRDRRAKRDSLWAKADKAQGPAKAELMRQGLDALNLGRDPEFGRHNGWGGQASGPYEPIHKLMKEADPADASGSIRWLGFSQSTSSGVAWKPTIKDAQGVVTQQGTQWWKELEGKPQPTAADYAAAEACIDRELADPHNKMLEPLHIQSIMKAKYDLYLRMAKGNHEDDKVMEIQRQIAKVDPDTFWGVGAIGYLGMYYRSENPFLSYGFNAKSQAKAGKQAWIISDAWQAVDHAGAYQFTATYKGGTGALKILRIAPVLDGKELGSAQPANGQNTLDASHRAVTIPFTCAQFPDGAKVRLKVEYEAQAGGLDLSGGLAVEPVLVEEL